MLEGGREEREEGKREETSVVRDGEEGVDAAVVLLRGRVSTRGGEDLEE